MHTPSWLSGQTLIESLQHEPSRWEYAQAVRILELSGVSVRPVSDPVYGYPCTEITRVDHTARGCQLHTTCHGLVGYNGTLPYVYQDIEQTSRLVADNTGFSDLLSLLCQKTLMLTSKVACSSSLSYWYEQHHHQKNELAQVLLMLFGLPLYRTRLSAGHLPADNLVRYAEALQRPTTNIPLLSRLLNDYFDLSITLPMPNVVRMAISTDCLTRLRCRTPSSSHRRQHCAGFLGHNAALGQSCYLLSPHVHVVIRVESRAEYLSVINDASLPQAILTLCELYFSHAIKCRLHIDCPMQCLSAPRLSARPTRLSARLGLLSCLSPEHSPQHRVVMDLPTEPIA